MYCRTAAIAAVCLLLGSCARHAPSASETGRVEHVAVLRFENLSGDVSLDWMGRALSEVLIDALTGSTARYAIPFRKLHGTDPALGQRPLDAPGISAERPQALAAGATRVVYGEFSVVNGTLNVAASVENPATGKTVETATASGPLAEGMLPVAARLAGQLGGRAQAFGTRSQEALRAYALALEAPTAERAAQALAGAAEADPNFGQAYLAWLRLETAQQNRAEAERVLERARARGAAIRETDRAELDLEAAMLRGDPQGRERALTALARLRPADPDLHGSLAQLALSARQYARAIEQFRRAVAIDPNAVALWNLLGYTQAYAGNLTAALESLRHYQELRPEEANPLDSMGDVSYAFGRFQDAEKFYLEAHRKDASFLAGGEQLKAAQARLMSGDVAGADAIFRRYADERKAAKDALVDYRQAEWNWLSGRRRAALDEMRELAGKFEGAGARDAASRPYAQLALWRLELGDREAARSLAKQAIALGPAQPLSALMDFLTEPHASASEWTARAQKRFAAPVQSRFEELGLAYALLLDRDFASAARVLEKLYGRSDPNTEAGLPVLLAWAYVESGREQQAARLVEHAPLPQPGDLALFTSLYTPRLFFLRGAIAAKQGRRDEALRNYRLFLKLSGPEPEAFGEEERARRALSS